MTESAREFFLTSVNGLSTALKLPTAPMCSTLRLGEARCCFQRQRRWGQLGMLPVSIFLRTWCAKQLKTSRAENCVTLKSVRWMRSKWTFRMHRSIGSCVALPFGCSLNLRVCSRNFTVCSVAAGVSRLALGPRIIRFRFGAMKCFDPLCLRPRRRSPFRTTMPSSTLRCR